jgi:nucleoid DNA-binding protein
MTKADLVEQVTASIARTAGPMISKKDCARVVDAFLEAARPVPVFKPSKELRALVADEGQPSAESVPGM